MSLARGRDPVTTQGTSATLLSWCLLRATCLRLHQPRKPATAWSLQAGAGSWWLRHRTLGTFSHPPTPGSTGFAGRGKPFVPSLHMSVRLEGKGATYISLKVLYQKKENIYIIFFLMSAKWKLPRIYASTSSRCLKLLWALGTREALPSGASSLGKLPSPGSTVCSDLHASSSTGNRLFRHPRRDST